MPHELEVIVPFRRSCTAKIQQLFEPHKNMNMNIIIRAEIVLCERPMNGVPMPL